MTLATAFIYEGDTTEAWQFDGSLWDTFRAEFLVGPTDWKSYGDKTCYTCDGTGRADRGWCGLVSLDGTCPDCKGTGVDQTPMGTGSDHCPYNGTDWKQPCGHNGRTA